MATSTRWSTSRTRLLRRVRIIHRNLGYLMVGVCLVYGASGLVLNRLKDGKDLAHRVRQGQAALGTGLSPAQLPPAWRTHPDLPPLNRVMPADTGSYRLMLKGGLGEYNPATGEVRYEVSTVRPLVYWANRLHYNRVKGWSFMADFFAVSLIFFALSGLVMVRGRGGVLRRGKWYLVAGLLVPLVYVWLS